ncbi:MAG: hypothetical protein LUE93_14455 [Bacteroides sp.]|nr:hypothetical protein [Bacteroides sp.]
MENCVSPNISAGNYLCLRQCFFPVDIDEPEVPVDTAYVSLGIDLNTYQMTRAYEGEAQGTAEENFVRKVRIVLYDGEQPTSKVVKCFDFEICTNTDGTSAAWTDYSSEGKDLASTTRPNDKTKFITYARKVPATDLKMLVVINTTSQLKALTEEGSTYQLLTQGVKIENNLSKTDNIGGLAQTNHFLMTSGPGLITIPKNKLKATIREAHNDPASATVARVVSKVTLESSDGSDTFPTNNNAAVANIQWELDITNRYTYWLDGTRHTRPQPRTVVLGRS